MGKLTEAQREECATYNCTAEATRRFEYGGVGSEYCLDCYLRVRRLPKWAGLYAGLAALREGE